ncbi:SsgA family sporulation/cell division regulator [Streptomyces sp. NPDC059378]|uniref:SsgA family sporulation/cell division regulator n=1 Tax=Streptomyces sp. NPDC059378 TaxID=3346815 RepID=UPI003696B829
MFSVDADGHRWDQGVGYLLERATPGARSVAGTATVRTRPAVADRRRGGREKPMESVKTVIRRVAIQLVVARTYALPMRMSLRYEPTDPYVVRAAFSTDTDELAEWVLGRDLLADGLTGAAGSGNIRVWATVGRGDQAMYIVLGSPAGTALLEVPVQDVKAFLEDTQTLVPRGTESGHIDWDIELANLFATG